jgi:hypothetical protein
LPAMQHSQELSQAQQHQQYQRCPYAKVYQR